MAVLSAASRRALPKGDFVFPGRRAYPIHNRGHAIAALSMVAQHGTPSEQAAVRSAVDKKYPGLAAAHEQEKSHMNGMIRGAR